MSKNLNLKDRVILVAAKSATHVYIWSTRFGKQTPMKKALRASWKLAHKK